MPDTRHNAPESIPRFACLSRCGRYFATYTIRKGDLTGDIILRNRADLSVFCKIANQGRAPRRFIVNSDQSLVALTAPSWDRTSATVFDRSTNRTLPFLHGDTRRLEFSTGKLDAAYIGKNEAYCVNLDQDPHFKMFNGKDHCTPIIAFFDPSQQHKAQVLTWEPGGQSLSLHDLESDQKIWQIDGMSSYLEPFAFSPNVFAARRSEDRDGLSLCRMNDGKEVRRIPNIPYSLTPVCEPPYHSQNGRYFLYPTRRPGLLSRWVTSDKWFWLQLNLMALERKCRHSPRQSIWTLFDLESGRPEFEIKPIQTMMSSFDCHQIACFQEDNSSLTTIHDDGLYDWDLPPKMRWFTPWAWAALAAWLSLGGFLMRGRLHRRKTEPISSP